MGAVLAELILDGGTATPLHDFSIGRFADGTAQEAEHFRREFDMTSVMRVDTPKTRTNTFR